MQWLTSEQAGAFAGAGAARVFKLAPGPGNATCLKLPLMRLPKGSPASPALPVVISFLGPRTCRPWPTMPPSSGSSGSNWRTRMCP